MASFESTDAAAPFYRHLLRSLQDEGLPFLLGGAWAFAHFTGIRRPTKDLDIFIRRSDWDSLARIASRHGYTAELTFAHWLGKVHEPGGSFVDVIFSSGNGLSPVDDAWFEHATPGHVLDLTVPLAPIEETVWTKAFIMERERYDGADVVHLIRAGAGAMNWKRLLDRFDVHWRVLLAHLVLFGFVYPDERALLPRWLMDELARRLAGETHGPAPKTGLCAGTLLSREQYLPDVAQQGYEDPRLVPEGAMTESDLAEWTAAIGAPPPGAPASDPAQDRPEQDQRAHPE